MRFARQLKINNASTKLRLLTHKIYLLINDQAADYSNLEDQQINRKKNQRKKHQLLCQTYESFANVLAVLDSIIPVISINSMFLKIYQVSMIVSLILNISYIPLGLSFLDDEQSLYFNTIPEYINIFWIFIHANTAYYEEIQIIENRSAILTNYVNNYLLQDLFVILPHLFQAQIGDYQNISLIFKFKQLSSTLKELSESVYIKENIQIAIDIVKSVLFQIYIQHFIGCTFHYLGQYQRQNNPNSINWLDYFGVAEMNWQARYVTSIYWSVITSITVGYGDITPKSTIEQLFVTIVALVLCGALGFTINSIGEVLRQLNEKESTYKSKMKAVDMELKKRDLNPVLQLKVKRYYQQMLRLEQSDNSLGEQLMDQLNPQLELDVKIDSYKRFLKRAILLKYFKDETLNKLCSKVKILKFGPGTEVIQSKSQSESLIFLIQGNIKVLASDSAQSVTLKVLSPPAVIGEQQFAESGIYNFQMNSIGNTQIGVIERDDFYKVLREDQEELEKFFQIRDKCLYNISQKNLVGETCDICDWTHSYLRCPLAFLQIDQYKVISNACQNIQQQRLPYRHRRTRKYNALKQANNTEDKVYLFKCNLRYESEYSDYDIYGDNQSSFSQFQDDDDDDEDEEFSLGKNNDVESFNKSKKMQSHVAFNVPSKKKIQVKSQVFSDNERQAQRQVEKMKSIKSQVAKKLSKKITQSQDTNGNLFNQILQRLNNIDLQQQSQRHLSREGMKLFSTEEFQHQFDGVQNFKYYYPSQNICDIVKDLTKIQKAQNVKKKIKTSKRQTFKSSILSE